MQRSLSHTSKSFGPQSMVPRRFLFACLRMRVVICPVSDMGGSMVSLRVEVE